MKAFEIDSIKFKVMRSRKSVAKVGVNMMFAVCKCGHNKVSEMRKNPCMLCTIIFSKKRSQD